MTVRIRFTQDAVTDLEQAHAAYAKRDLDLGGRFLDALDLTLDRIARFPSGAAPVEEEGPG